MKVGDIIKFKTSYDRIPPYTVYKIPLKFIKHGHTEFKINRGKIIALYKKFYIVEFEDVNGKKVSLGFKADVLILQNNKLQKLKERLLK